MSDSPKDLEHYLANPDELPTDPAAIDALLGIQDTGVLEESETEDEEEVDSEGGEAKQADKDATAGESDKPEATQETQGEQEDAPILSKDGKHTIPYSVLASERERRQAAERVTNELQQRISDLEARMNGTGAQQGAAQEPGQTTETDLMSDEDLEELTRDFPAVKKLIDYTRRLEGKVGQFAERFKTIEEQEAARAEEAANASRNSVRAAVDANPTLLFWEQQDPEKWAAAIEADSRLRGMPVNQGLSLEERFEKAVKVVEAIYGPTQLPAGFAPAKVSTSQPQATQSTADLAAKAKEVVEKAGSFTPKTLSDMPGGAVPSADPLEDIASLSTANLGAKMANMTPDQINSLLARLG